jgi:hypothetical protein
LFGIKDIFQLRRAIFSDQDLFFNKDCLVEKTESIIKKNLKRFSKPLLSIGGAVLNLETLGEFAAELLENKYLENFIICIDDLERKEDSISDSEILGFINNLRENRNCHIVLLFNENIMNENQEKRDVFSEYREKVLEHEFHFELGMIKSYDLIFKNEVYFEGAASDYRNWEPDNRTALAIFNSVQMTNIRIMKKVKAALDYFVGQGMRKNYPNLWPQFSRDIIKCCWLYFAKGKEISLEDIFDVKNISQILQPMTNEDDVEKDKISVEFKNKIKLLREINFIAHGARKDHEIIREYLENGFVNLENAATIFSKMESSFLVKKVDIEHRKIWNGLWGNFQMNSATFIKKQLEFIKENFDKLSLNDIEQVSNVLHDLAPDNCEEIEELMEGKIDDFIANSKDENLIHSEVMHLSSQTQEKVKVKFETQIVEKTIEEIIESPSQNVSRYFPPEILSLKSKTVDDFYNYLITSKNPKLLEDVKRFFDRLSHYHENSTVIDISKNLKEALYRSAQLSKINYKRVYVGIRLTPPKNVEEENALSSDNSSQ